VEQEGAPGRGKVRLEMARDMLPESINVGYARAGLSDRVETTTDVWMFREVDWQAVPRPCNHLQRPLITNAFLTSQDASMYEVFTR
jgi:hypothetical protein